MLTREQMNKTGTGQVAEDIKDLNEEIMRLRNQLAAQEEKQKISQVSRESILIAHDLKYKGMVKLSPQKMKITVKIKCIWKLQSRIEELEKENSDLCALLKEAKTKDTPEIQNEVHLTNGNVSEENNSEGELTCLMCLR